MCFIGSYAIEESTYRRWQNYGTLFGVTKDSFVCLSADKEDLGTLPLDMHMQSMYYQMSILSLVQRASILRFSWEISQITNKIFRENKNPKKAIRELYENYIRFINQIYFREITSQIQGIELYSQFQKMMNIEKEAKDLDVEMQEVFNYLSVQEQTKLGKMANIYLPVTLLAGVLGINTIDFPQLLGENFFIDNIYSLIFGAITWILILWCIVVFCAEIYKCINLKKWMK